MDWSSLRRAGSWATVMVGLMACAAPSPAQSTRPETQERAAESPEPVAEPIAGATTSASTPGRRPCGSETCAARELCVATRGAMCLPLPPQGESCPEDCVQTEHCCNCTAYACLTPPEEDCPTGPSCDCLDAGFLGRCDASRRRCVEGPNGVDVVCTFVALDEDPFSAPTGSTPAGAQ